MFKKHRTPILSAIALLIVAVAGCPSIKKKHVSEAPTVDSIPDQVATTLVEVRIDLSSYVTDLNGEDLHWEVISGEGDMENSEYVNVFNSIGSHEIQFQVTNESSGTSEGEFSIDVEAECTALVQRGNHLDLLDATTGALYPVASGGISPITFRLVLPNGWLVYERLGGSSIDLFACDLETSFPIGQVSGLNTLFDSHSIDSRVFFERGSAIETGLYTWNPYDRSETTIAWRRGMHNRNAFVSPITAIQKHVIYFEYGNNGQSDIYYWRYGDQDPATVFSSDHQDVIRVIMPDGGIVFSTKGLSGEDDLLYYRLGYGPYSIGGDLPASVQDLDMTYRTHTTQSIVLFETGGTSRDLWMWSPLGLNSHAVADSSSDEQFQGITADDQIAYSIATSPENDDLRLYRYSTDIGRDIASGPDNEVFEGTLRSSGVVFAVEKATGGRDLYRYDSRSDTTDEIAVFDGKNHSMSAVLDNDHVVFHRSGESGGTFVWDPVTAQSTFVAGPGSSFVSDCGGGDFAVSVAANGQTDLALWDESEQQLAIVAETPHDERFEAAFSNGVILYSAVIAPKTTSDLFRWRDGDTTRISSDDVDHAVVDVLSGAR